MGSCPEGQTPSPSGGCVDAPVNFRSGGPSIQKPMRNLRARGGVRGMKRGGRTRPRPSGKRMARGGRPKPKGRDDCHTEWSGLGCPGNCTQDCVNYCYPNSVTTYECIQPGFCKCCCEGGGGGDNFCNDPKMASHPKCMGKFTGQGPPVRQRGGRTRSLSNPDRGVGYRRRRK